MSSPLLSPRDYAPPANITIHTLGDAARALIAAFASLKEISRRVGAISLQPEAGAGLHGVKAGDLDAAYITVLSPATPDETFEVAHFLGRTPIGFAAMPVGKPAVFYAPGEIGGHGWGPDTIKLCCSVSNVSALILVY